MKYFELKKKGILKERISSLDKLLVRCSLCPRNCGVNRLKNEKGHCRSGYTPIISSANLHFGEEPPISGANGSGTIFLANCNLNCCFCQNYPISQLGNGNEISIKKLSQTMLELQEKGAHNINFVSPTHFVPQVVRALDTAIEGGLKIPLVYNSGGYDSVTTLKLLEGIFDVYMPDAKYADNNNSKRYSNIENYFEVNRNALIEMHRQVGALETDSNGIAVKGLLIRHLVLPGNIAGSEKVLRFIAKNISKDTYMSIMSQYHPAHKATKMKEISRRITKEEYERVLKLAEELGLENGWHQEL